MVMRFKDAEYRKRISRDWIDRIYPFLILLVLVVSVILPIAIFNAGSPTLSSNPISQMSVSITIITDNGKYELFSGDKIKVLRPISEDEFYQLSKEIPSQCINYKYI